MEIELRDYNLNGITVKNVPMKNRLKSYGSYTLDAMVMYNSLKLIDFCRKNGLSEIEYSGKDTL